MHWRKFAIRDIPFQDTKAFEEWVLQRWIEKDDLLEGFQQDGCFPADNGFVFTNVTVRKRVENLQLLGGPAAVITIWWMCKSILSCIVGLVRV